LNGADAAGGHLGISDSLYAAWLARVRVNLCYLVRHQKFLKLDNPSTFNELVQRRKLENRDVRMVALADKVTVKEYAAALLGSDWVIPSYWTGDALPDVPPCAAPFVVKARHGCNQSIYVRDEVADWSSIRARAARWTRKPYGQLLDEWAYGGIPLGLLIEPFIGERGELPIDYKIFVFGGRATHVQVHLEREKQHRWIVFDRIWNRVSSATKDEDPERPASLVQMLDAAETLARGFDFVRCDFYEISGKPLFGEMTFYPGSGLDKFSPVRLDSVFGQHWLAAGGR
jgi:hypothetical protein